MLSVSMIGMSLLLQLTENRTFKIVVTCNIQDSSVGIWNSVYIKMLGLKESIYDSFGIKVAQVCVSLSRAYEHDRLTRNVSHRYGCPHLK